MKKTYLSFLLACFPLFLLAQLRSGPMLGYAEMREVAIWLQTEQEDMVHLEFRKLGGEIWQSTGRHHTEHDNQHIAKFIVGNLEPGTTYEYRIFVADRPLNPSKNYQFKTQPLWQWRQDAPNFRWAMGSCNYVSEAVYDRPGEPYGGDYHIFGSIAATKPDMMLWLGDNVYLREADWSSASGMAHRYAHTRQLPEMQALLAACPQYAIWDDHDFGPNDANGSWVHKQRSLELFQLYWANNGFGLADLPGITNAFRFYDVDFFLLDNRYHRSSERLKDSCAREILGQAQIDWLINALKFSNAPFKIVAVGSQVLNSEALYENYAQFPCERRQLLDRIAAEGIKNVVFVTGDRHHSEISRLEVNGIVMHDITASPLTSKAGNNRDQELNRNRIPGSLVLQRNYTLVDVVGNRKNRSLQVKTFNSEGKELYRYIIEQQR